MRHGCCGARASRRDEREKHTTCGGDVKIQSRAAGRKERVVDAASAVPRCELRATLQATAGIAATGQERTLHQAFHARGPQAGGDVVSLAGGCLWSSTGLGEDVGTEQHARPVAPVPVAKPLAAARGAGGGEWKSSRMTSWRRNGAVWCLAASSPAGCSAGAAEHIFRRRRSSGRAGSDPARRLASDRRRAGGRLPSVGLRARADGQQLRRVLHA